MSKYASISFLYVQPSWIFYLFSKRLYCFLFFTIYASNMQGQLLKTSEPMDITNEVDYTLIAKYKEEMLLYRQTPNKFFIQGFDNELKETWKKELDFEEKSTNTIKIIAHKERFFILYSYHKRSETYLRCKELNPQAEELDDFEIGKFDSPVDFKSRQIILSQNKMVFLIYNFTFDNSLEVINYNLLNKKTTWQKNLRFPELKHFRDFQQLLVNNNSDVYVLFNQNNTKAKRKKHQFTVCHISPNSETKLHHIPFNNYISYDMQAQFDEANHQLVFTGLYATENYMATGIFYFHTNFKSIPSIQTSELEETFMRSLTGKKKKKITGVQNFIIAELVLRKDGGALLVAEQRFAFESSSFFSQEDHSKTQADYLYENLLVASIHPSGKVYWKDVLFKSQSSENDRGKYSSFFTFTTPSTIRFLYNNEISWDTSIFEYVVSGNGNIERNVVTHQEKQSGFLPQLKNSIQVSSSEFFALSERDKKLTLLKINY